MPCGYAKQTLASASGSLSLDIDAYDAFDITLSGNASITFTGNPDGRLVVIALNFPSTGYTVTWDYAVFRPGTSYPTNTELLPATGPFNGVTFMIYLQGFNSKLFYVKASTGN